MEEDFIEPLLGSSGQASNARLLSRWVCVIWLGALDEVAREPQAGALGLESIVEESCQQSGV